MKKTGFDGGTSSRQRSHVNTISIDKIRGVFVYIGFLKGFAMLKAREVIRY